MKMSCLLKRMVFIFVISLSFFGMIIPTLALPAAYVIDQGDISWADNGHAGISSQYIGQSFIPGVNNLARVSAQLSASSVETVTCYICTTFNDDAPTAGEILDQATASSINGQDWVYFDFDEYPLAVNVDITTYWIVLKADGGTVVWKQDNDVYARGEGVTSSYDMWFQTFSDDQYPVYIDQGDVFWTESGLASISSQITYQQFQAQQSNIAEVRLSLTSSTATTVTLYVTNTYTGVQPTGGEIIVQTTALTDSDGSAHWITFDFTSNLGDLTIGNYYYLIPMAGGSVSWIMDNSDPYSAADSEVSGIDFWFETYFDVTVDEISVVPAAVFLCVASTLVISIRKRK